jgi:hypothetical protein
VAPRRRHGRLRFRDRHLRRIGFSAAGRRECRGIKGSTKIRASLRNPAPATAIGLESTGK